MRVSVENKNKICRYLGVWLPIVSANIAEAQAKWECLHNNTRGLTFYPL